MVQLWLVMCLSSLDGGAPEPEVAPTDVPLAIDLGLDGGVSNRADPHPTFVKGELSVYLGSDRLVVKNTRLGVSLGVDRFDQAFYALVEPLVDLRFLDGKLGIGLGVPLRFEIFSFAADPATGTFRAFTKAGSLRTKDWDSVHDFGRALKYVTYGRKEDRLFISAGQRYSSTIGHGSIVRRYAPNLDIDYPRASLQIDAYNDSAGFELATNDLLEWNQLMGLAFIKPFSFLKPQNLMMKTLSIGVSAAVDWKAPWQLVHVDNVRQLDADGRLLANPRVAALVGIDAEVKVVKTDTVDVKPYVDLSALVGGDVGMTLGVLGRFNAKAGEKTVHAFRVVLEGRYLGNRYQPSYFDTFYEVDRFAYLSQAGTGRLPKQRYVMETGLGTRGGYYLEASWGIPQAVGVTLAIEGVTNSKATNLVAHLELPVLSFLQLFGSYYLRGVESFTELGQDPSREVLGLFGDKAVAFAGARLKVLPILFINTRLYKTFRMSPQLRGYDNQFGFVADLELGYEFKKDEKKEEAREQR